MISFLFQAAAILVTATIIHTGFVEGDLDRISSEIDWKQLLPIALLSFQSAGQIVKSRALGLAEIPTVVVTSMLHDITTDRAVLKPWKKNVKRNRRVLAFVGVLVGAVSGGFIAEATGKMQIPLWIAGGLKVCISGAWAVWPETKINAS